MEIQGLVWAVVAFLVYVVLHIALVRTLRPKLYMTGSLRLLLALLACYAVVAWKVAHLRGFEYLNSLLLVASLWVWYMELTVHLLRSVSIGAMMALAQSPGNTMTSQAFEQLHDLNRLFDHRIESLIANRYAIETDRTLRLTPQGVAMARLFTIIRRLFNLTTYG